MSMQGNQEELWVLPFPLAMDESAQLCRQQCTQGPIPAISSHPHLVTKNMLDLVTDLMLVD